MNTLRCSQLIKLLKSKTRTLHCCLKLTNYLKAEQFCRFHWKWADFRFNLIQYIQYQHALDSMSMQLQLFLNWADFKRLSDHAI